MLSKSRFFAMFLFVTLLVVGLASGLQAQSGNNVLDLDGVNDHVAVANGSAAIANTSAFSLNGWVYSYQNTVAWPNYEGFFGFRNDTDADFYLARTGATALEARFRNSSGTAYDVVVSNAVVTGWHYWSMTYDGATLTLYRDGVSLGTTPATGTFKNDAAIPLYLGRLDYGTYQFLLQGQLDNVTLWTKALSAAEVQTTMTTITGTEAGLDLFYDFNQGTAGGANSAETTLLDRAGVATNGTLTNFGLSGGNSNWVSWTAAPVLPTATVVLPTATVVLPTAPATATPPSGNNVVDFNGSSYGYAQAAGAIVNTSDFSLSSWIYAVRTGPEYEEWFGFRNNDDADFYIAHAGGNTIEARFRNSSRTAFTVTVKNVVVTGWHYWTITYDGATLSVYRDGVSIGATPATGTFSSSTSETLYLGRLNYNAYQRYFLKGQLDNFTFWTKALSAAEIQASMTTISGTEPGLEIFYDFNQGTPGGDNSAETRILDRAGVAKNGWLINFALKGSSSNYVSWSAAPLSPLPTPMPPTPMPPTATRTPAPTRTPIPAPSETRYVNSAATGANTGTSWANAYTTLIQAFDDSAAAEIWVAAGRYSPMRPNNDSSAGTFNLRSTLALYGGFAGHETTREQRDWTKNVTILDGQGKVCHVVTIAKDANYGTVLDGFTITGGGNLTSALFGGCKGISTADLGGGVFNNTGSPILSNLIFTANIASTAGSGMYNIKGNPTLTDVTFSNNKATLDGGGLANLMGDLTLTNVTFTNNSATDGGGMFSGGVGRPTLTNVTFTGNTATNGGGLSSGDISLNKVTFSNNKAENTGYGGGMYIYASPATLDAVTFTGNSAYTGGGLYINKANPTLDNVTFTNNTSGYRGGAIDNMSSSPSLNNVTLSGNKAVDGGGIFFWEGSPTLTNVTLSNNTASNSGGGICGTAASLTLTNVTLSGNKATNDGGGLYNYSKTLDYRSTLNNTTLSDNTASNGGGLYSNKGTFTLNGVTFKGNTASGNGGGLSITEGSSALSNTRFSNNTAVGYGGGMYNYHGTTILTNTLLTGNKASSAGGGLYTFGGSATLTNATFTSNTSSFGGGLYNGLTSLTLRNSVLWGNSGSLNVQSSQLYSKKKTGTISTSVIQDNPDYQGWLNPSFDADGRVTATSLQFGTTCAAADLAGVTRKNPCTLGAYEFNAQLAGSTKTAALQVAAILANQALTWNTEAGITTLDLSTGAVPQPAWIFYAPTEATAPALTAFTLSALADGTFQTLPDFAFTQPATLTLPYASDPTQALELRRYDASYGIWTTEGITPVDQTATTRSFTLSQVGAYGLFPAPSGVWLELGASSPVGLQTIPGDTLLAYQLTLHNPGQDPASGVVVTDTLPVGVMFEGWLNQGATWDGTQIIWQPATVPAVGNVSLSFTARASNVATYQGQTIVNMASYTVGDTSASAQVAFSLNAPPSAAVINVTTPANTARNIYPLLSGISNPDGSPLTVSIGTPLHGTAAILANTITYTPTTDFLGTDTFTYTVQDGTFSANAEVQVRVADLAFPNLWQQVNTSMIYPSQILTYELTLDNGAEAAMQQGTVVYTLPVGLTFGAWLTQDTATLTGRTITWGPSNLALDSSKTIRFTVVVAKTAEGTRLANTAQLTAANADPTSDTFTLNVLVPQRYYLPVVGR